VPTGQLAATAFTALAAAAAWRTAGQGERLWMRSVEPDLHPQILLNRRSGTTDMVIVNVGGGTAWGVYDALVAGGKLAAGEADDGILQPGGRVHIHGSIPQSKDAKCVISWRIVDEASWAIDRVGPKRRLRRALRTRRARTHVKPRKLDDVWALFYPDAPLDGLENVAHDVRRGDPQARR
jgi:hypothetical protein